MKSILMATLLVAGCANQNGCTTEGNTNTDTDVSNGAEVETDEAKLKKNVTYLCVGMEKSSRFGDCPGCKLDATRLNNILGTKLGYKGTLLISNQATKSAVVSKLKAGIEATPANGLFLFCYSGHGGQEYLGGTEPDGADRKDEYLCLYDTYMLDDEIWSIVSKCKGRVFLYFDACHSATMYRSVKELVTKVPTQEEVQKGVPLDKCVGTALSVKSEEMVSSKGFTFRPERFITAQAMGADGSKATPNILCWSGCKEAQYSYGGSSGGVMTSTLVKNWKKGITYKKLWPLVVKGVQKEQPSQNPIQTFVGSFSDSLEAFK